MASLGVIFRDSTGNVIAALSHKILLPKIVELAEALAAKRAVLFVVELSIFKAMFEGDHMRVVQALNAHGSCLTLYGHVIEETRRLGSTMELAFTM